VEISELQSKIEQLQYELNIENQRGGLKDAAKVESLEKQITELKAEMEKPEVDPVIERAEEEIELFGVPLGAYFTTIADHVAVRSVIIPAFRQLKQEIFDVENSSQKEIKELKEEAFELNDTISQLHEEITKLKSELYESQLLAADNATKRDNASNELLEAKKTIDELNDKITAAAAPKSPARTNLDGAETVKKEKRVIHSVVYEGKWNEQFKAILADTEEEIKDYTLYKDIKYTEVTAEKAIPFRTEYLAAQQQEINHEDHTHDIPANQLDYIAPSVNPDSFRDEEDTTESAAVGLVTETSTVVGSPVTREEHEELKARVAALESIRAVA
jgi:chromosome segregation ATPase